MTEDGEPSDGESGGSSFGPGSAAPDSWLTKSPKPPAAPDPPVPESGQGEPPQAPQAGYGHPGYAPPPGYGPPGYGPPPYGPPGYGSPGYGYAGYGVPSTEGNALAALLLAIGSFLICPVIPAIVALVLAGTARRNIEASGGAKTGEGMVTAARIIAWIHLALVAVGIVAVVLVLTVARHATSSSTSTVVEVSAEPIPSSVPVAAAPVATTTSGCTTTSSVVASPNAGFPSLPAGADPRLAVEPTITIPAGRVPTALETTDIVVGGGAAVGPDASVTVNYVGVNYVDCAEFDSSWSRSAAATFSLPGVIPGFARGIGGDVASGISPMRLGGRRVIIVPPSDGYGAAGGGEVAGNEELVFIVDLLAAPSGP